MQPSILIKNLFCSLLFYSGVMKRRTHLFRTQNKSCILMYHRIVDKKDAPQSEPGMITSPSIFKMHIRQLKKHFNIISLENFYLKQNSTSTRPSCVITFDDGWLDFYQNAFPIIKNENVPVTVFLPTAYIGTNRQFWTDEISKLIGMLTLENVNAINHPIIKKIAQTYSTGNNRVSKVIHILKDFTHETISEVISLLKKQLSDRLTSKDPSFLSWEQVRELFNSGLVTFGSHTVNHSILTVISQDKIEQELHESKGKLISENCVNPSFISFCYPNGNVTEEISTFVKDAGYHAAVRIQNKWTSHNENNHLISRVGIHGDISCTPYLFLGRTLNYF